MHHHRRFESTRCNLPKSQLEPSQSLEFLGFLVDSIRRELSFPKEKVNQIKKEASKLLQQDKILSKNTCTATGQDVSSNFSSVPCPTPLPESAESAAGYSPEARQDLQWWSVNLE